MGSLGIAVGSGRSGVSTRTILGPLGARSPVTDRCPSVPFILREGSLFHCGRAPFPPPHPCVSRHLGPRITGAITPVMSHFSAFVTGEGGDSSTLPRPWGVKYSEAAQAAQAAVPAGLSNFLMRLWRSRISLEGRSFLVPLGSSSGATALTTSRLGFGGRPCLQCWKNCIRSTASSTVLG